MAISAGATPYSVGINSVSTHPGGGGIYRVGEAGVVVSGNQVAAFDDTGALFTATDFADGTGLGLGNVTPYLVYDNGDGTFDIYYQVRDADPLPTTVTNWVVTFDLATGAATGPAATATGAFGVTNTTMLTFAEQLPNGNIFLVGPVAPQITDAAGNTVVTLAPLGGTGTSAVQQSPIDIAVSGNNIFYTWVDSQFGEAGGTYLQIFDMTTGAEVMAPVMVSEAAGSGFGLSPSVQAETLSDGRVVVVWTDGGTQPADSDETSVWFRIYNADGTQSVGPTLVNTVTVDRQDTPLLVATETGFVVGYSVLTFVAPALLEGRLREYDNDGNLIDTMTGAYSFGTGVAIRTDNNTAFILDGQVVEIVLPGADGPIPGSVSGSTTTPTAGNDTLTGTAGGDLINGGAGDDSISGGDGNDGLRGEDGNDTLDGGAGDDSLPGANGDDVLRGGTGNDRMGGGFGNDQMLGGDGNDSGGGGPGNDTMDGGAGDDLLSGGSGDDTVDGGAGNDTVAGSFGSDLVRGGAGHDSIGGGNGFDTISGGDGNDTIGAGGHDDSVTGDAGNDFLGGGDGNDTLDGGTGMDTLNGGNGDDRLTGGADADVFVFNNRFGDGADVITDFQDGVDMIRLVGLPVLADPMARVTITDVATGAEVVYGNFTITVEGVAAADLTVDDFLFT